MGLAVYPIFDGPFELSSWDYSGEILGSNVEGLETIAHKKKLSPLTAFADNRDVPDDFDGSPEDLDDVLGPFNEWFPASDGSAACKAIAAAILSDKKAAKAVDDPHDVAAELDVLAQILDAAHQKRLKFRLELG